MLVQEVTGSRFDEGSNLVKKTNKPKVHKFHFLAEVFV